MPLSRSKLSIRRLVRPESPLDTEDHHTSERNDANQGNKLFQPVQWSLSTRRKRSDQEPVQDQNAQITQFLQGHYPVPLEASPRTSSSSLTRVSTDRQRLVLFNKDAENPMPLPLSINKADDTFSIAPFLEHQTLTSTLITLEPLETAALAKNTITALSPIIDAAEPETPSISGSPRAMATSKSRRSEDPLSDWASSLQQLIQETDLAFEPTEGLGVFFKDQKPLPTTQQKMVPQPLQMQRPTRRLSDSRSPKQPSTPPPQTDRISMEDKPLPAPPADQATPQMGAAQLNRFSRKPVAMAQRNQTPPLASAPVLTPAPRKCSVSKATPTRTGSNKKKNNKKSANPKKMPKWLMSQNVQGILTGQIFKKVEADEMLSPEQLRKVRDSEEFQQRRKASADFGSISERGSFDYPLSVPDTHQRSASISQSISMPSPPAPTPTTPGKQSPIRMPFDSPTGRESTLLLEDDSPSSSPSPSPSPKQEEQQPKSDKADEVEEEEEEEDDDDLAWLSASSNLNVPPPPPRNPARQTPRVLHVAQPPLPTIPEIQVTSPVETTFPAEIGAPPEADLPALPKSPKTPKSPFAPTEDEEFVFYYSTPFSFNTPTFQHGPIRLPKPDDMVPGMSLAPDTTLDWTAFQMAILGGAGDFFSDPSEFAGHANETEVEDLASWFDELGLEGPGQLLTSEAEESVRESFYSVASVESSGASMESLSSSGSTKSRLSVEYSPSCSTASDPDDLPIPIAEEYPSGFWNGSEEDAERFMRRASGIKRWSDGHPRKPSMPLSEAAHSLARDSISSLPQSPMMDLVFMKMEDEEDEVVPMGYNLHHDLGDFLKWEAENAYACSPWGGVH